MPARILVTRPLAQNKGLVDALTAANVSPVIFPLLAIKGFHPADLNAFPIIQSKVLRLAEFDTLIFVSTNAATIACEWFDEFWPQLPEQSWLAIGKATAIALNNQQLFGMPKVIENTTAMNSEALLSHPRLQACEIKNKRVLVVRGVGGRETLKQTLQERGASVEYLEVYQREGVHHAKQALAQELSRGLQVLTITSGETLDKLLEEAMMNKILTEITALPLVVPSLRLYDMAIKKGFLAPVLAKNAGVDAMMSAVKSITNSFKEQQ